MKTDRLPEVVVICIETGRVICQGILDGDDKQLYEGKEILCFRIALQGGGTASFDRNRFLFVHGDQSVADALRVIHEADGVLPSNTPKNAIGGW